MPIEIPTAALVSKAHTWLLPRLGVYVKSQLGYRRSRRKALDLLHLDYREGFDFRLPTRHPVLPVRGHPDDFAAFTALADPLLAYCAERGLLSEDPHLTSDLGRNMVIIGSPEAEPLARLAYGYRRKNSGPGLDFEGDTLELPYRWHEDPTDVVGRCSRFVAGAGLVSRPNWPLIHEAADGSTVRLAPEVDNDGLLITDWLAITVSPNFLTRRALDEGKRLVSVAGTHGVGTRAIGIALRDNDVVAAIGGVVTARDAAFQIILSVGRIRHDQQAGSIARSVQVHDIVRLSSSEAIWREANRAVARRFSDWLVEDNIRNEPLPHERI